MKKTIISICTAIALGTAVSCTDNFEDININPNKIYEANMESIFPGSVYKTINAMAELNYNQMCWWARYSGHFGGSVDMNESTSDSFYKKFYVEPSRYSQDMESLHLLDRRIYVRRHALVGCHDFRSE